MKLTLLFLALSFVLFEIRAQNIGQNPSNIRWKQIESLAGVVIFPNGMETKAQRLTNLINYLMDNSTRSVGNRTKRIQLILQNQTVVSNGYVDLGPFRSEIYCTPPQDIQTLGSTNWLDMVTIHEYRHVQQLNNTLNGLTKWMYYLQGQNGWNVFANLSVPDWYFEGDAVIMETALTESGRGRIPSFTAQQRALAYSNIRYSYQKSRNGSYKDLVPNRYPLGYMMLTHLRNLKGNDITNSILKDASAFKGVIYPFNHALKKNCGFGTVHLYKDAWQYLESEWKKNGDTLNGCTPHEKLKNKNKTVTDYHFPQITSSGKIIALKNSYKKTDAIVEIDGERERKLAFPGKNLHSYFKSGDNRLIWTEISQDPIRTNVSYSDIYLKEGSKRKIKLTKKGKYFSPILSEKGKNLVAVYITPNQVCSLRKIDLQTRRETILISFESSVFIARPAYCEKDSALIYIALKNNRLALWKYNMVTGHNIQISPESAHVIDAPTAQGEYVYFSASYNGIDNIYRCPVNGNQRVEQLTSVLIGAYEPSVSEDGKRLIFTEHGSRGNGISILDLDEKRGDFMSPNQIIEPIDMTWQDRVAAKEEGGSILEKIPDIKYRTADYKGLFKGFTLHSWNLLPSLSSPSLNLLFNNYLNDVSAQLSAGYNINEKTTFFSGEFSMEKWFPLITLRSNTQDRSTVYFANNILTGEKFREGQVGLIISQPFSWIKGNYNNRLTPRVGYNYIALFDRVDSEVGRLSNAGRQIFTANIDFSLLRRSAYQNLFSRFGADGFIRYFKNSSNKDQGKVHLLVRSFLPGISANHSFKIVGSFQKELLTNSYQFIDNFEYARGFQATRNDMYFKLSFDYSLPLMYPDFGILGITYFKRIRANFFFDYGKSQVNKYNLNTIYQSVGMEIVFDNTLFNAVPASLGFRLSYLLTGENVEDDIVVPFFFVSAGF